MKTQFERRPKSEVEADSKRMLEVVLRPGFNLDAYWKNLRKDLPKREETR
jgi:hypothetical protein